MKLTARLIGILFIIGTISGILSVLLTRSVLDNETYLQAISDNETRLILGAMFVLIMAFSLAMIPVLLFPIFRKYNEALALGAVLFRGALEAFAYIAIAFSWLLLVTLSRVYAGDAADMSNLQAMGSLLRGVDAWGAHIVSIVFSVGALMIYWLFYVSKLIPRWLALWGLVGAVLYLAEPLLAIFGQDNFSVLVAPLAIQEMVLAVWLIVKGFSNPAPSIQASNSRAIKA